MAKSVEGSASSVKIDRDSDEFRELERAAQKGPTKIREEYAAILRENRNLKRILGAELAADVMEADRNAAEYRLKIARFAHECGWWGIVVNQLKKASDAIELYIQGLERENSFETENIIEFENDNRIKANKHRSGEIAQIRNLVAREEPVDWTSYRVSVLEE